MKRKQKRINHQRKPGRAPGRSAGRVPGLSDSLLSSFDPSKKIDNAGRVLKGRKIDLKATARLYAESFQIPPIPKAYNTKKGDSKRKKAELVKKRANFKRNSLLNFANSFNSQAKSGRVPVKAVPNSLKMAEKFGVKMPNGSKVTFLPRKFAGKRISFKNGVPQIKAKGSITEIHFIDFLTDEFQAEIENALNSDDPDEARELIRDEIGKFLLRIKPGKGAIFNISLGTGDYAKGSSFDREKLKDKLADLVLSFIKSKGVAELRDFVTAINVIRPVPVKRK